MSDSPDEIPTREQLLQALREMSEVINSLTADNVRYINEIVEKNQLLHDCRNTSGMGLHILWHLAVQQENHQLRVNVHQDIPLPVMVDYDETSKVFTITALTQEEVEIRNKGLN